MKINELNEWLRGAVDKQVRISEDLKKAIEEQKKANDEQKKFNGKIFEWMKYIKNQNFGFSFLIN